MEIICRLIFRSEEFEQLLEKVSRNPDRMLMKFGSPRSLPFEQLKFVEGGVAAVVWDIVCDEYYEHYDFPIEDCCAQLNKIDIASLLKRSKSPDAQLSLSIVFNNKDESASVSIDNKLLQVLCSYGIDLDIGLVAE